MKERKSSQLWGCMMYDESAERAILGTILHDSQLAIRILSTIDENDFFFEHHRHLYTLLQKYYIKYKEMDYILLKNFLESQKESIDIDFIEQLVLEHVSEEVIEPIIEHVQELARKRKLQQTLQQAQASLDSNSSTDIVSKIISSITSSTNQKSSDIATASEVSSEVLATIEQLAHKKELVAGIPTGFIDLDVMTTGFHESDFIILAARPAMGKSSFMLSMAYNIAKKGIPVGIFSLEMSKEQLLMRLLSSVSKIDMQRLRTGMVTEEEIELLKKANEEIKHLKIYIIDKVVSMNELSLLSFQLLHNYDVKIVFIDYLQLIKTKSRNNRQEEVAEISRNLKALAKELKIPVVALAQLSRQTEQRSDKRPLLSDLRESGQIEQDADLIIFLHRPEYYKKKPLDEERGLVEVIIAKQRQGPTGIVRLKFQYSTASFEEKLMEIREIEEEQKEIEEEKEEIEDFDVPF